MLFFGRPIYAKSACDEQDPENDIHGTRRATRLVPYFCALMRKILFILLNLFFLSGVQAQIFVLDAGRNGNLPARLTNERSLALESDETDETNGAWQVWMDSATRTSRSSTLPIGFPFRIGTATYSHLRAGSNGYITFDTLAPLFSDTLNRSLPVSGLPVPALVFGGFRLNGSNDKLLYRYSGAAPHRSLWIKWYSASIGENFAYAEAVIGEDGSCWMGWMHSANNGQKYVKPAVYMGLQTSASQAFFPGAYPLQPDSASTDKGAADNHFAAFLFDTSYRSDIQWLSKPAALQFEQNTPPVWSVPAFSRSISAAGDLVLAVSVNGAAEVQRRIPNPFVSGRVANIRDTLAGLSDTGFFTIRVRIVSYAGIAEQMQTGDTLTFLAAVHNPLPFPRKPLLEYHTASWCAECPGLHPWLTQAEQRGALVLEHHLRDGMTHANTNSIGSNEVPALFVGGLEQKQTDTGSLNLALTTLLAKQSPYRLRIEDAALSATGMLSYKVRAECGAHFSGEVKMLTGLREKFQRGLGQPWQQQISAALRNDTSGGPFIGYPATVDMYFHPRVAWRFMSPYGGESVGLPSLRHRPDFSLLRSFNTPLPDPVFANVPVTSVYSDRGMNVAARFKPYETEIFAILWTENADGQRVVLQSVIQPLWDFASGAVDAKQESLRAWPNPSTGQFTVRHSGLRPGAPYAVYSAGGTTVMQGELANGETTILLPAVAPGVYWFRSEGKAISLIITP